MCARLTAEAVARAVVVVVEVRLAAHLALGRASERQRVRVALLRDLRRVVRVLPQTRMSAPYIARRTARYSRRPRRTRSCWCRQGGSRSCP